MNGETGVSPDQGFVGEDLQVVISGEDFQTGSSVGMIPNIHRESRILNSLTLQEGTLMAQSGDMIYLAGRNNGLNVVDIHKPTAPHIIGHTDLPGWFVSDLFISLDVAYVAAWNEGLQLIDISDPENPQLIKRIVAIDIDFKWAQYVRVSGSVAYVVIAGDNPDQSLPYPNGTMYAIDVGNTDDVKVLGSIEVPNYLSGFEIKDDLALLTCSQCLIGIDISNPEYLEMADSVEIYGVDTFCISDQTAFAVGFEGQDTSDAKIYAINISDSRDMRIEGKVSLPYEYIGADDIAISGPHAFVLMFDYIWKINIEDPTEMQIIGNVPIFDIPCCSDQILISGDLAFVSKNDFYVIDIGDMENPGARLNGIASAVTAPNASSLILLEDRMYVVRGDQGVSVFDVADPEHPQLLGTPKMPDTAAALDVSGHTMYVGAEDGIRIYNVSDPQNPILLSSLELIDQKVLHLALMDTVLIVDANTCEYNPLIESDSCQQYLRTIDVNDPNFPALIGSVPISADYSNDMIISGHTGYLLAYSEFNLPGISTMVSSELFIIDLNDPFHPAIVESTFLGGKSGGLAVTGDTIFVSVMDQLPGIQQQTWLMAVDISNPIHAEEISRFSIPGIGPLSVYMGTAYIALDVYDVESQNVQNGIWAVDIRDPQNMRLIAVMNIPQLAVERQMKDLVVLDDLAYLATVNSGVFILPLPVEAKNVRVDSPTRISATLPGPKISGSYTLRVFDKSGNDTSFGPVTFIRRSSGT
jgi:hypothetical protein